MWVNYLNQSSCFWRDRENLSVLERLEDLDILKNDRTFNTAGIYTDEFGKTRFTIMKPIIISKIITSCIGMKNYPIIGIQI
jgi:hypothetical protein